MRLSRKTLALAGGAAGRAIGGALLWALRTPDHKPAQELYEVTNPNRAESITGGPADYGSIPKLGPPLPGDLGRPIVSAQNAGETVPVPGMAQPPVDPRIAAAEQARQRALQEREADSRCWRSAGRRSEEHTSELQSLMRISYAVFCLKNKKTSKQYIKPTPIINSS